MVLSETLYLILTGTVSAIAAWIIINAIKYIHLKIKNIYNDVKQVKEDMEEFKSRLSALEESVKRNE